MMAIRCFKLAGLYLIAGMSLGVFMGATQRFNYAPVHAHINLLGWTLLALAGLIFARLPQLAETRLAKAFFWIYNVAVPLSMIALAIELSGNTAIAPVLGITSVGIWLGGVCFALNLLLNLRGEDLQARQPQAGDWSSSMQAWAAGR